MTEQPPAVDGGCIPWEAWAPPIDPPTAGGLPADQAQCIADTWWDVEPHLAAALMWEAYAAMLPPTPTIWSASTGAQSIEMRPAQPVGTYGMAMQRAAWHRTFVTGQVVGVPMNVAPSTYTDHSGRYLPPPWWTVEVPP